MINTATEQVFSLSEFARQLKKLRGIDRDYSTIRAWCKEGWSPRGRKGPVVKLETIAIMGVDHTSLPAFDRFVEEQTTAKARRGDGVMSMNFTYPGILEPRSIIRPVDISSIEEAARHDFSPSTRQCVKCGISILEASLGATGMLCRGRMLVNDFANTTVGIAGAPVANAGRILASFRECQERFARNLHSTPPKKPLSPVDYPPTRVLRKISFDYEA